MSGSSTPAPIREFADLFSLKASSFFPVPLFCTHQVFFVLPIKLH